ncbi:MAG: hypothetical protein LBH29_03800, partial [Elusimicrobiota bacterium]|nr:hypothetical protein [Elusimicrobiota bacterium]
MLFLFSTKAGSATWYWNGSSNLADTSFSNQQPNGAIEINGAGAINLTANLVTFDSNMNNSNAAGGAIRFVSPYTATITGNSAIFSNNVGGNPGGGAIYVGNNAVLNFNITSTTFIGNNSGNYDSGDLGVRGGTFKANNIRYMRFSGARGTWGGSMYLGWQNYAGVTIVEFNLLPTGQFIIEDAVATKSGGGINGNFVQDYDNKLTFNNGTIIFRNNIAATNNTANTGGGALSLESHAYTKNRVTISFNNTRVEFTGNYSYQQGGVIYLSNNAGSPAGNLNRRLEFNGSTLIFTSNTARFNGGIIYSVNGDIAIANSVMEFIGNESQGAQSNGTIGFDSGVSFTMTNIPHMLGIKNRASNGGFLYVP